MNKSCKAECLLALIIGIVLSSHAFAAVPACTTGGYTYGADFPADRYGAAGVVVGRYFYVIGGWRGPNNDEHTNTTYAYDPVLDTWEKKANIPEVFGFACAAALDGKIYFIGNCFEIPMNTLYIYDTETDTWTQGANLPVALANAACTAFNDKFYVAGGYDSINPVNTFYAYDPAADAWTTKANMPGPKSDAKAVVFNEKIYVIGGYNDTNYEWDPGTNTWATKAAVPVIARMPALFTIEVVETSGNWDLIYLFGNSGYSGYWWNWNGTVRFYDIDANHWYGSGIFGTILTKQVAPASGNYHDALWILAGGQTEYGTYVRKTMFATICAPYAAWIEPAEVPNYDTAQAATIKGLNFDDQTGSGFWLTSAKTEIALTVTVTNSKTATTTLPADLEVGTYGIKVKNSAGSAPNIYIKTTDGLLTVTEPIPEITSIDPDSAEYGTGELDVTIEGNHFFEPVEVNIEGPSKAKIECESPDLTDFTTIECTLDLADAEAGTYDLVVTTDNGDGTLAGAFEVTAPPSDDDTDDDTDDDSGGDDGCGCGC